MKTANQGFSLIDILFVLALGVFLIVYIYSKSDAEVADINTVTAMAGKSAAAQNEVKRFLMEHPAPNVAQLIQLKDSVNEILVRENTLAVVGTAASKEPEK